MGFRALNARSMSNHPQNSQLFVSDLFYFGSPKKRWPTCGSSLHARTGRCEVQGRPRHAATATETQAEGAASKAFLFVPLTLPWSGCLISSERGVEVSG